MQDDGCKEMSDLIKIKQHLIEDSWQNWLDFHFGLDCEAVMERWCRFVDDGDRNKQSIDPWGSDAEEVEVLPDIAERINMLNSTHCHTFIKAWYIRHPWK
jgi:hypothetical protein